MFKSKDSDERKILLTYIFKEYEQNLNKKLINKIYLNDKNVNYGKINLNIDINIKKENYIGLRKPVNKMKLKIIKLKKNIKVDQ
jgi:hypothetical protein